MTGPLVALGLTVSALSAEAPEVDAPTPGEATEQLVLTDAPAPWAPGPELFVSPQSLRGLQGYQRYQRLAGGIGVPLFLGGAAVTGVGAWWLVGDGADPLVGITYLAAGGSMAWAGAGVMTYGSVTAAIRLFPEADNRFQRLMPGYIAYGLLGVSALGLGVAQFALILPVNITATALAFAAPFGVAAGIPALAQIALNGRNRRDWQRIHVAVVPQTGQRGNGLTLVASF